MRWKATLNNARMCTIVTIEGKHLAAVLDRVDWHMRSVSSPSYTIHIEKVRD